MSEDEEGKKKLLEQQVKLRTERIELAKQEEALRKAKEIAEANKGQGNGGNKPK
jgi:hypothetical protein